MEEIVVTRLWMAGVVSMMAIFAIIAVIGYWRKRPASSDESDHNQNSPGS